jgi:hypothetical protein
LLLLGCFSSRYSTFIDTRHFRLDYRSNFRCLSSYREENLPPFTPSGSAVPLIFRVNLIFFFLSVTFHVKRPCRIKEQQNEKEKRGFSLSMLTLSARDFTSHIFFFFWAAERNQ